MKIPFIGSVIKRAIELKNNIPTILRDKEPYKVQEKTLKKLLKKAGNTSFGEHYNFYNIIDDKDITASFKSNVPVFDYNSIYKNWWYRCLNGEPYICCPGYVYSHR